MVAVNPCFSKPTLRFSPPVEWSQRRFVRDHVWVPLGITALLVVAGAFFGADQKLADLLYAWEGYHWALRGAVATDRVIHQVGHDLSLLAWTTAFTLWTVSLGSDRGRPWRKPLGYLVLSTLLATALVAWIKSWSNMDCPWDLLRYGGDRPFVGLFDVRPIGLERGRCFPAAHASAGYAWLSLYFFLGVVRPGWRYSGLLVGLGTGLLFGVSQQLRGAHFISHDLWAFALCWGTTVAVYRLFWPGSGLRDQWLSALALEATLFRALPVSYTTPAASTFMRAEKIAL